MADLKHDIDKYLRGEMTPAEMNALEKKALNDPFIADALEGAAELSPTEFAADLNALQHSLAQRIQKKDDKNVIPLWAWASRIAAGLAVVAISSFIIFQFTKPDRASEDLSMKPKETEATPAPTPEVHEQPDASLSTPQSTAPAPKAAEELKPIVPGQTPPQLTTAATEPAVSADYQVQEEVSAAPAEKEAVVANAPVPAAAEAKKEDHYVLEEKEADDLKVAQTERKKKALQETAPSLHYNPNAISTDSTHVADNAGYVNGRVAGGAIAKPKTKVVTGKVTGEDGEGLPGVNVMIKGTSIGTITDGIGNYQITVSEEDPKLVFSFIGYTPTESDAKNKNEVDVHMDVDAAQLSEVVVVGYGDLEKDAEPQEVVELASPVGGKRAFKQYLEKNLLYPQQAIENKVEGRVTIQFTVESTGLLSNFTVVRGIGYGCDQEVIRLVKQGPQWIPTKRSNEAVRDRVKVRMKFAIPKK